MRVPGIIAAPQSILAGAAGGLFTPPIALDLYCDARYHDALANGANVASWTDLSGNGRHLPAETGGSFVPPTFARDTFGAGAHTMRMGANKAFRIPNFWSAWAAAEIWLIARVDADPAAAPANTGLYSWYPGFAGTNYPWTDSVVYDAFFRTGFVTVGNPARSLAIINVVNISHQAGAGGYVYRLNEAVLNTSAGAISVAPAGTDGYLGYYPSGIHLAGNFGMIGLKQGVSSAPDRAAMYAWLKAQWPGLP